MITWKRVLIHHSAGHDTPGLDADDIDRQHRAQGWRRVGYHALVEKVDGTYLAIMGRPLHWEGSHCPGQNRLAIGVCLIGDFTLVPPPAEQLACAAELVAGLCVQLGIPVSSVQRHRDYKATACPGDSFPIDAFRAMVKAEMGRE